MDFYFPPLELSEYRQKLIGDFKKSRVYHGKDNIDSEFRDFVFKLVSLKTDQVEYFIRKQPAERLMMLASYLPYNDLKVNLDNVIYGLEIRHRNTFMDAVYKSYQLTLGNIETVKWLREKTKEFPDYMINDNVRASKLNQVFKNDSPLVGFFRYATEEDLNYESLLIEFSIFHNSILAQKIDQHFLIFANRKQYLAMTSESIISRTNAWAIDDYGAFLNNYLKVLSVEEFHDKFLGTVNNRFGLPSNVHQNLWSFVEDPQKIKCMRWFNLQNINMILGKDVRTLFWKQYLNSVKSTYVHEYLGRLALEFSDYVVVEFKQTGNATYIYRKEYFNSNIKKYFSKHNNSNHQALKNKDEAVEVLTHSGNWQYKFSRRLTEMGIRR